MLAGSGRVDRVWSTKENLLKYFAAVGTWTWVTGRTDSDIHSFPHWAIVRLSTRDAFAWLAFLQLKWIPFAKFAKHFRRAIERCNLKKHLLLLAEVCNRNQANRISRLKVGASIVVEANVKVTTKRLDCYIGIKNRERSFDSNRWVKVERTILMRLKFVLLAWSRDWIFLIVTNWKHANGPKLSLIYLQGFQSIQRARDHRFIYRVNLTDSQDVDQPPKSQSR